MVSIDVNGLSVEANATSDTPLLWVLRDHLDLDLPPNRFT
jgi:aerobic-type carbon monoxide dehydrogenase small subunit (CoxS/CutS family)